MIAIILIISVFIIIISQAKGHRAKISHQKNLEETKATMVKIAMGALMQPGIWSFNSNIWSLEIIPTLNGKNISLAAAIKKTKKGRLYLGKKSNPLVTELVRKGHIVLNIEDKIYSSLIKIITGIIDLEKISLLKAINPVQLNGDKVAQLLLAVNNILKKINKKSILCMFASGLSRENFFEVKLPLPKSVFFNGVPSQYLAVNPKNEIIEELAVLFQQNPQLAIHRTLRKILSESKLYSGKEDIIINKSAKILISEI